MIKNIRKNNIIYNLLKDNLHKHSPLGIISIKEFSLNNSITILELLKTKNKKPFNNSIKISFPSYNKNFISAFLSKKLFCSKNPKNTNIDFADESSSNKKKLVSELEQKYETIKQSNFNEKEKLQDFIDLCANINKSKFLTEEIYLKYLKEILTKKTEDKFSEENLNFILEILTKNFNLENDTCHKKWNHFVTNYLTSNKNRINFIILINKILDKVDKSIVIADNSKSFDKSNHEKKLKKIFYNKIFDLFLLENVYEIPKFAACNYQEAKLLIKLFTPQFIERSKKLKFKVYFTNK